ncbi:MAG TPA: type II toxin-antitoxin system VapC family toxin [Candidatus Binatia bacterium]|nr:type II toxin-antitoxin system VapC family toxin [Candidatus Binatia bacterium]
MNLLLDTHVWIWSQEDPDRLGAQARRLLLDGDNQNHVCTVSTLELARLCAIGAVEPGIALREWVGRALRALQARTIEVSHDVALEAYSLPGPFHKDPADRLLVAASRCHALTIVTADERILSYRGARSRDARR